MMTRTLLLQVENHVTKKKEHADISLRNYASYPLVSCSTIFIEQIHIELLKANILNDSIDAVAV